MPSWFHYFSHTHFSLIPYINHRCYTFGRCSLVPSRTWTLLYGSKINPGLLAPNPALLLSLWLCYWFCLLNSMSVFWPPIAPCEVYFMFVIRSPDWTKSGEGPCTSLCAFCNYREVPPAWNLFGKDLLTLSSGSFPLLHVVTYHGLWVSWWAFLNTFFFFLASSLTRDQTCTPCSGRSEC